MTEGCFFLSDVEVRKLWAGKGAECVTAPSELPPGYSFSSNGPDGPPEFVVDFPPQRLYVSAKMHPRISQPPNNQFYQLWVPGPDGQRPLVWARRVDCRIRKDGPDRFLEMEFEPYAPTRAEIENDPPKSMRWMAYATPEMAREHGWDFTSQTPIAF